MDVYHSYLSSNNIKHSKQRELILEVFLGSEEHLTVQELFELVRKADKNIGVATVYRAMKIFCDSGLADEIDVGDGNKRYEHKYNHKHHDHLICRGCGKIIEFCDPDIEALQTRICEDLGFKPTEHRLQIYGLCKDCCSK